MPLNPDGPSHARTARVVYLAVSLGAAVAAVTLVALRAVGAVVVPDVAIPAIAIRAVAVVLLVGATVALRLLSATLPPRQGDLHAWWATSLSRAVAIWAVADGAAILGAVAYLLFGDALVLALAAGWAVAMFVRYAPVRLTDG